MHWINLPIDSAPFDGWKFPADGDFSSLNCYSIDRHFYVKSVEFNCAPVLVGIDGRRKIAHSIELAAAKALKVFIYSLLKWGKSFRAMTMTCRCSPISINRFTFSNLFFNLVREAFICVCFKVRTSINLIKSVSDFYSRLDAELLRNADYINLHILLLRWSEIDSCSRLTSVDRNWVCIWVPRECDRNQSIKMTFR